MFLLMLLLGFALLFLNLSKAFSNKLKYIIPSIFVLGTLFSFFFREYIFFCATQTFFFIFTCIALSFYLIFDLPLLFLKIKKKTNTKKEQKISLTIFFISFILTIIFLIFGIPNNANYKIRNLSIPISKEHSPFSVVFFTDLHLDPLFKASKLEQLAIHLDSLQPDYIFFGGDLADMDISALNQKGFDKLLQTITSKAKKETYAVLGNHEAYMTRNGSNSKEWMQHVGMKVLVDSTICNEDFCLTGRQDFQVARLNETERLPLEKLVPKDTTRLWLLLDHQPHGIEETYQGPLPLLSLSGHTHNGQFFPGTILIDFIWPLDYGLGKINNAPWLVSSGVDSWGPPVRIGSDTEIWFLSFTP